MSRHIRLCWGNIEGTSHRIKCCTERRDHTPLLCSFYPFYNFLILSLLTFLCRKEGKRRDIYWGLFVFMIPLPLLIVFVFNSHSALQNARYTCLRLLSSVRSTASVAAPGHRRRYSDSLKPISVAAPEWLTATNPHQRYPFILLLSLRRFDQKPLFSF